MLLFLVLLLLLFLLLLFLLLLLVVFLLLLLFLLLFLLLLVFFLLLLFLPLLLLLPLMLLLLCCAQFAIPERSVPHKEKVLHLLPLLLLFLPLLLLLILLLRLRLLFGASPTHGAGEQVWTCFALMNQDRPPSHHSLLQKSTTVSPARLPGEF